MQIDVPEPALAKLREVFTAVEGSCEAWTDEEVARRILVRGAMDYAKAGGREWSEVSSLAAELRTHLGA